MTDYTKLVEALRRCAEPGTIIDECDTTDDCPYSIDGYCGDCMNNLVKDAADAIEALQAQLPKRGEWIDRYDEHDKPFFKRKYVCSACGNWNTYGKSNYCPKCGSDMRAKIDGPIITPCRGCSDYDGYGGCKSKGGCARAKMEVQE